MGVREQEQEWIIPFPNGNGKGMEKDYSQNSGTGREWKKGIPEIREWEGMKKYVEEAEIIGCLITFKIFQSRYDSVNSGMGKGMRKTHSQNSGTGRE